MNNDSIYDQYMQLIIDISVGKLSKRNKQSYIVEKIPYIDVLEYELLIDKNNDSHGMILSIYDYLYIAIWCFTFTDSYKGCLDMANNHDDKMHHVSHAAHALAYLYYISKEWFCDRNINPLDYCDLDDPYRAFRSRS